MRWSRRRIIVAGCAGIALVIGQSAHATIDNLKTYKPAYPDQAKTASCKTCHEGVMGTATNLNGYGKALKQLPAPANPRKLTVEDYQAAAAADQDQDGATTMQELEAGTDPSDPTSTPTPARTEPAQPSSGADTPVGQGSSNAADGQPGDAPQSEPHP